MLKFLNALTCTRYIHLDIVLKKIMIQLNMLCAYACTKLKQVASNTKYKKSKSIKHFQQRGHQDQMQGPDWASKSFSFSRKAS